MKTIKILLSLTIALFFSNCSKGQSFESMSVPDFESKLKTVVNAQLLDVRTSGEYAEGAIANAKNIDWNGDNFEAEVQKLDKSKPVFVYCLAGGRSKKAAKKLNELGFSTIYEMDGGYMKWSAAHPPIQKTVNTGMAKSEYEKLISSDKVVVINFFAEWCGPCKKMGPYITKMTKEYQGKAKIVRVDADKNKSLFNELGYTELPVVIVFKDGKEIWKKTGFVSEEELKAQLQ
jgi:thioredoxin